MSAVATKSRKTFKRIARVLSTGEAISLSAPSKMPCYSWSIPAGSTCPGAKLSVLEHGENAVCGSCYAQKGFYNMPSTQAAQLARRAWIARSLSHDGGAEFVRVMTNMVQESVHAAKDDRFRGHDSGDFFSVPYIEAWIAICSALPSVRFWFPTRSYIVANLCPALERLAALPNVSVRPSGLEFDVETPIVSGFAAGTTVIRSLPVLETLAPETRVCPATADTPQCAAHGCDACWTKTARVAYIAH